MPALKTFISQAFRPEVFGGRLDKAHKTPFTLGETCARSYAVKAICFGPKKDNVLINLEHCIKQEDKILIFYYEDLHERWTFISNEQENYFLYQHNEMECYKLQPDYLYIRGCYIEPSDPYWLYLGDFFSFIELWEGKVLCAPQKQISNESKLYQLANSLKKSALQSSSVSIGQSYVIKGLQYFNCLEQNKSYIVKSLSGVRSIVVDDKDFSLWDFSNLEHLPVLFQEKVEGYDLRVHVLKGSLFAKRSLLKEKVDYRYDKHFLNLKMLSLIMS